MNKKKGYYYGIKSPLYKELQIFREKHPYRKITFQNNEWEYIDTLEGQETVLFLTGASGTGDTNIKSILRYKNEFRIISPSYPPVGTMDNLVEGIINILKKENIGKVHIIGGSLGSAAGHIIIRRYPEMVDKLVLMTFGLPDEQQIQNLRKMIKILSLIPYYLLKKNIIKDIRKAYSNKSKEEQSFMVAFFRELMDRQLSKKVIRGHFIIALDMALNSEKYNMDNIAEAKGKVLIIQAGDDESFNREQMKRLVEAYPGAETRMFETGGHMLPLKKEDEVSEIVVNFLKNKGS